MCLLRKHISIALLLLLAASLCFAATTGSKIQNIPQENIRTIPVLLVEFSDTAFTLANPAQMFHNQLNQSGYSLNGAPGCAAEYFNGNFQGKATFEFPIAATVRLENPIATYGAHSTSFNDTDITALLLDACAAALEQGTDFSIYDTNSDGIIENIAIIYAGYSESEGGDANAIWAHQKNLQDEEIIIDGMKILSYTCTPELKGNSGTTISLLGTFCHEIAHSLGLPDMYDTNSDAEGLSHALYGTLSIMDRGNTSGGGNIPPYFTSIEREILEIAEVEDLVPDSTYTLEPVNLSGKIFRIRCAAEGEYFLLECRTPQMWDKSIGGGGLVVYHIDKSEAVYGGLSCLDRWEYNNINSFAEHPCAIALAATDTQEGASVFFPGESGITELSSNGKTVKLRDWNGNGTGTALTDIAYTNGKVTFTTVKDYSSNASLPKVAQSRAVAYQNEAKVLWEGITPFRDGKKGQWLAEWWKKDDTTHMTATTDTCTIYLTGLEPGMSYNVKIRYMEQMELGDATVLKFKTLPITSDFPYIFMENEEFSVGESLDLRVLNLPPDCTGISWTINGKRCSSNRVVLTEAGYNVLEAIITYNDGSKENIYKRISVE